VQAPVLAKILTLGRHTIAQLLTVLGQSKKDWTAWYRLFSQGGINEERLTDILLDECLQHFDDKDKLLVLGGDGTQTPRASTKMEGVGYGVNHQTPPFKRGVSLTQRWFHGALFLLVVGGQSYQRHGKEKYRESVSYLVNAKFVNGKWALPFSVKTLLFWAWQR
jgi:hypothetical protein